jgi:dienelactone hydrolase
MKTVTLCLTSALFLACGSPDEQPGTTRSSLQSKEVVYEGDGITMKGYLAWHDSITGPRPGVIVVHQWWGLNDHARTSADRLARMGYVAFALDLFGDGRVADNPDDARAFTVGVTGEYDQVKRRFDAALRTLQADPHCQPENVAAIGFCFGGGIVLNMARLGVPLKAFACFHGSLAPVQKAMPGSVKGKVLVMNGADDTFVSPEAIVDFKSEMDSAGVDYEFVNYPGALHAFTDPAATETGKKFGMAVAYNEEAAKKSWAKLAEFLESAFE